MNVYVAVDWLNCIFEAILAFMLFGNYMEKREKTPRYVYAAAALALAAGMYLINTVCQYTILNLVLIVVIMTAAAFTYSSDIKTKLILSVITVLISTCSELITLFFLSVIISADKVGIYTDPSFKVLGIAVSKTINLAIVKIICLLSKKNKIRMPAAYWIMFITVFAVDLAAMYLIFRLQPEEGVEYMPALCTMGLLYSVLVTLFLYEHMSVQAYRLRETDLLEQQYKAQVKHLKELIPAKEQMSLYHDLSNHMLSLKSFLDHSRYEEMNEYFDKVFNAAGGVTDIIDTGNTVIDTIIGVKRELARKSGIEFSVDMQIPAELYIDPADCCVILGNALDNAIEACEGMESGAYISLTMAYREKELMCKITNSVPPSYLKNKTLKTTKTDTQNHGIGIKNIKRTLEKYKNIYRMEYEDREFVFSFILYDIPAGADLGA